MSKPQIQWSERVVKVDDLQPYEKNPRQITAAQFDKLVNSIKEMGYHQRCIATPNLRLIGGHQRLKAFKQLGIEQITVLVPDRSLTTDEFRRLLLQDNIPFGTFDFEMLAKDFSIGEMKDWGMPVEWLAKAKPPFEDVNADEVPALEAKVVSERGDIWLCGGNYECDTCGKIYTIAEGVALKGVCSC